MRAKEFITETAVTTLTSDVALALPAVYTIGALPNSDFYKQYRFGVAMAGAKGARNRANQDDKIAPYAASTEWGENMVVTDHMDPELADDIDYALRELGLDSNNKKLISTRASEEGKTVDKNSPIKAFKGYPR
jgi:hypothetical protein